MAPTVQRPKNKPIPLTTIAKETKGLLPSLTTTLPQLKPRGMLFNAPKALERSDSPGYSPVIIHVVNNDTIDAALDLATYPASAIADKDPPSIPLILNMANAGTAGGGWLNGAMAQEEAICFRSSLSLTLKSKFYPMKPLDAIYSPCVVILREALTRGHALLDVANPESLPVVAVVSIAALSRPKLTTRVFGGEETYAVKEDMEITQEKMRIILRIAGQKHHTRLILGALGCGVFRNPPVEVATLWREVLQESEWTGWFKEIVFAVLDKTTEGNLAIFTDELEGITI